MHIRALIIFAILCILDLSLCIKFMGNIFDNSLKIQEPLKAQLIIEPLYYKPSWPELTDFELNERKLSNVSLINPLTDHEILMRLVCQNSKMRDELKYKCEERLK